MNSPAGPDAAIDPHAGAPASEAGGNAGLDIGDLLRIISERRWIILGGAVLGALLGIAASLLITPMYRASALLQLNSPDQTSSSDTDISARGRDAFNSDVVLATQLGLLRSESLSRRVVQELNLVSNPAFGGAEGSRTTRTERATKILQSNIAVEASRGSLLITLSYSSPDPELAARITNTLAKSYIASGLERQYDSSSYARDFLSNQLAATKAALEKSERDLNAYAMSSGIFRAPDQVSATGGTIEGPSLNAKNLDMLSQALVDARIKRIAAENAYRNTAGDAYSAQTAATMALRQQRALLVSEYEQKTKVFKPEYPEMQELKARIAALDSSISSESGATTGGRKADLRAGYLAAKQDEDAIAARVDATKGEVQGERGTSIQYNILKRESDTNRALYDALLQRYKEIGVAGGIGSSIASLIDEADAPISPYRPNLILNILIGLLAGTTLGMLIAVVAHMLFDNVVTPQDVRSKLGLPVLGIVPREDSDREMFDALDDRKSTISEAYHSVRTALLFADPAGLPRTILLTSGRPGEGKSTSAYAIANSFARTGTKVLLIDADLRKPTFVSHRTGSPGLAQLLTSEDRLLDHVEPTRTDGLTLLPVGHFQGSPAEMLGTQRLHILIEEAKAAFGLVVIDGPPVLGLADAPMLGAVADKTVFVIESRESRTGALIEMVRRMRAAGASILGVVLTKTSSSNAGYGYNYNYYSYSYGDGQGGRVSSAPGRAFDVGIKAE